ncbi:HAD family hydrolase [Effusibacillus dendaii]|uniref:Haloacid dehalogenase n=1 Tax=Effusibacillus dendaii TaxID=2743772 RepID=A0A7I8D9V7_9BACL|nr:HAD family hydrolase [Effusibacillus dendaii]BCJ86875.1 haloacid dehalogenase [Effusibacillus dendaii]
MKYTTVLFDVDGVMLGEDTYFNATSQTVHELIVTERFLGQSPSEPNPDKQRVAEIRRHVLGDRDEVLDFLKGRGVNSNWDMVYLLTVHTLLRNLKEATDKEWARELCRRGVTLADFAEIKRNVAITPSFEYFTADFPAGLEKHQFLQYLNQFAKEWVGADTQYFGRSSQLWEETRQIFQEFYLGDGKQKPGYLDREEPIVPGEELQALLKWLAEKGVVLGIGTGRPTTETLIPLGALGVLNYISKERIATASTVLEAEEEVPAAAPLAKPHPFSYLRALRGAGPSHAELLQEKLPLERPDVLVVGDSLADLLAARALGVSFAATLTGHEGERARSMFEAHGADHILKDVREVASLFE